MTSRQPALPDAAPVPDNRPVWLLDVDGVINGTGKGRLGRPAPISPRLCRRPGIRYDLRWAPQLIARIRRLLVVIEVRRATSWIDVGTEDLERLFGLPALPHAYPANPTRLTQGRHLATLHTEAKTHAALGVTSAGRRLVWTDDESIPVSGPARDALDAAGALLIAPDPRRGLREQHLTQIDDFIACG